MRAGVTSLLRYCSDNGLTALLSEYSKDNPYSSDKIGFKSTIPCKWICAHGHIEYETPYNRVRRGYCKTCGRDCAVLSGKDIRSLQNTGRRKTRNRLLLSALVPPFRIIGAANTVTNGVAQ